MTEDNQQAQESQVTTEPEVQESASSDVNVADFIAESKKYRQRAQSAEKRLDKLQKQMDADRQKQMDENEQWKELAEERGNEIAELKPIVERANSIETSMREELLSDFPDEDQDDFKDLPLPTLRKVHGKLLKTKPAKTDTSVAGISSSPPLKKMSEMSGQERRENWSKILAGYTK